MSATYMPSVMPAGPRLRSAPAIYEVTLKDKSYRRSPIGQQVGAFLRALRWADSSPNTLDSYETTLARLSVDHDDWAGSDGFCTPVGSEYLREFLDRHWGDTAPNTRRQRLAAVKSFFVWSVGEGHCAFNPAAGIKPPKSRDLVEERIAYAVPTLVRLVRAQDSLRDQCALQLLCRMALRKDELRQMRVGDIDLTRNLLIVHGKGKRTRIMPLEYVTLREDLYLHVVGEGRHPDECLIHPRGHNRRPMNQSTVHRWFKRCLERAGLPATVKTHEMRHSAADHLWRGSGGNLIAAQQLLGHTSVTTTQAYLHPTRKDLADAMHSVDVGWDG